MRRAAVAALAGGRARCCRWPRVARTPAPGAATRACRSRGSTRWSWRPARCAAPRSWARPTWTRSTRPAAPTWPTATRCPCSRPTCTTRKSIRRSCARSSRSGLTRTLGVELQFPFRVVGTTIQYTTPDGQPYVPPIPACTTATRRWPASAIRGCSAAGARGWATSCWCCAPACRCRSGGPRRTRSLLGDMGIRHQHIQFGTGTFDPVAGFQLSRGRSARCSSRRTSRARRRCTRTRTASARPARFYGGVQGSHACSAR